MRFPISLLLFAALSAPIASTGQVTVNVSSQYRAITYAKTIDIRPGAVEAVDLPWMDNDDTYLATMSADRAGTQFILVDGRDRAANNPNPTFLMQKPITPTVLRIPVATPPSKEGWMVFLMNRSQSSVRMTVRIDRLGTRTPAVQERVRKMVSAVFESIDQVVVLPRIKVFVRPCGEVNAFSSPDITICSELMADLYEKNLIYAQYPILLHELGHSLLNIWGLPGYDNEDMADEFAAALLAYEMPSALNDFVKYLQSLDSVGEAAFQLTMGDRHTYPFSGPGTCSGFLEVPQT